MLNLMILKMFKSDKKKSNGVFIKINMSFIKETM